MLRSGPGALLFLSLLITKSSSEIWKCSSLILLMQSGKGEVSVLVVGRDSARCHWLCSRKSAALWACCFAGFGFPSLSLNCRIWEWIWI